MHFLGTSAILSWNKHRLKINSLTFFLFSWSGGQALCACACPDGHAPPFHEKKLFENILSVKIHFVKKSRNLSWVGAYFSLKWLKFPKNAWNFALVEIWSDCRCDMKIMFSVFDNLDIELLSHKIFYSWYAWIIWFWKCILH